MNIQSMMKQVQKIQKEMMSEKEQIDSTIYESSSSIVSVKMKGNKELIDVSIDSEQLEKEDIELLEDMILIAINEVINKIDKETEKKLISIQKECLVYFKNELP